METEKLIQLPAQVMDFRPRQDKSYRIVFETRQLEGKEVALLAENFQGEGWLLYKPNSNGISPQDIPTEAADAGVQSPAQRLRGKIYKYWKSLERSGDFESFYRVQLSKLGEYFEDKIT